METVKNILSRSSAGVLILLVILIIVFQSINPMFLSQQNINSMLRSMSYYGIIAVGMGLCLISGIIDLSVGATAAFASVMFASLVTQAGLPLPVAVLITLLAGGVIGLVNAFIILKLKITPFIATISTMFIVRGLAMSWNDGFFIYPISDIAMKIGTMQPLGVSVGFFCFIGLVILAWYVLEFTVFGLEIKATGSDYEVAKVTEVRYILVHVVLLTAVSILAALSGILTSMTMNAGIPTIGTGWEFAAITACAIGGISLYGYEGSMIGLVGGLALMQVLQNGIVVIGVSVFLQEVVVGIALLVAIALDVKRRKYLNLEKI